VALRRGYGLTIRRARRVQRSAASAAAHCRGHPECATAHLAFVALPGLDDGWEAAADVDQQISE
jgi:hypothetical protein